MGNRAAVKERKRQATAPVEVGTCRHHWIIETPRGAVSAGRCKLCGEERDFRNSANDYIWDDDSSSGSGYNRWSGVRSTPKVAVEDDDVTSLSGPDKGEVALVV